MAWRVPALRPGMLVLGSAIVTACGGGGSAVPTADSVMKPADHRAPIVRPIPDAVNSAYSYTTRISVEASDPDGDSLVLGVRVEDTAIAGATMDPVSNEVIIEPRAPGRTRITVTASDGEDIGQTSFFFEVGEVTRAAEIAAVADGSQAIIVANPGSEPVDFVLTHNGFRGFQSDGEIVAFVRDMPAETPGEPFERKLWRFVRDNVYHLEFLDPAPWRMSPTVLINSMGFGFCSSVAAAYARLARTAGYPARIWALTGHVVPEVQIGGDWQMYDPDLAVYYHRRDGGIAGVGDLADEGLVTAPTDPLFPPETNPAYDPSIAAIYASVADNDLWPVLLDLPDGLSGRVTLPPGSTLSYQGRWTEPPIAHGDGDVARPVEQFEQAALTLAPGWTGTLQLPWVAWDVMGTGTVTIGGIPYTIGSGALRERLQASDGAVGSLDLVASSGPVTVVFLLNPLRYEVRATNVVELTGWNVWRLEVSAADLPPQQRAGGPFPAALRKPVPGS